MRFARPLGLACLVSNCVLLAPIQGVSAAELTGTWATSADVCSLVFTKKGNEVAFTELSEIYGSGFVITGNRIAGKSVHCTIDSTKQDGNSLEISAACATSIMTQKVKFKLTFADDNTIDRAFDEVPGMNVKYYRCKN